MATSFKIEDWIESPSGPPVVTFTRDVVEDGLTEKLLLEFPAFKNWLQTLKASMKRQKWSTHTFFKTPYHLRSIKIQSFDKHPKGHLLFVKLNAEISNEDGEKLPGIAFLRGGSVAVLMIVRPSDSPDERYVIMTEQARIPAGSLCFKEIPAGMIDAEENFAGAAAKEIEEEVGLKLNAKDLIDMTKLATQQDSTVREDIQDAMYPSPGGCDEFINIYLWERVRDRLEIENLKNKLRGDRAAMENITVTLEKYEKLLEVGARDGKTLAAWSLYEYLKRVHPHVLKEEEEDAF
jgi:ADP-sugar diphosphatase